jgi:hypothetical protein
MGQNVGVDARMRTAPDSVTEIIVEGDPSRFVDSETLAVKARLTFKPGPLLIFPWDVRIDQAVWTIIP